MEPQQHSSHHPHDLYGVVLMAVVFGYQKKVMAMNSMPSSPYSTDVVVDDHYVVPSPSSVEQSTMYYHCYYYYRFPIMQDAHQQDLLSDA